MTQAPSRISELPAQAGALGGAERLVADIDGATVAAGSFEVGHSYRIAVLGTTDWQAIGASAGASVGAIFDATGVGAGTGSAVRIISRQITAQQVANLAPGGATDLSYNAATRTLASSNGADAVLPLATPTDAGLMSAAEQVKVGSITVDRASLLVVLVRNTTGATIAKGVPVIVPTPGSSGLTPLIAPADASVEATAANTIGLTLDAIPNNSNGYVVRSGLLEGVNTSHLVEGELVWLSETTGATTSTRPTAPAHSVMLGWCIKQGGGTSGIVLVDVKNGSELEELHDVSVASATTGQALRKGGDGVWRGHTYTAGDVGAEPAGTAASSMAAHLAAADPHSGYTTPGEAAAAAPVQSVSITPPAGWGISGPTTGNVVLTLTLPVGSTLVSSSDRTNWDGAYSERLQWDGSSTGLNAVTGRASLGLGSAAQSLVTDFAPASHTQSGSTITGAYTAAGLTLASTRLLGRTTTGSGAAEEISVVGATLAGGVLTITGGSTNLGYNTASRQVTSSSGTPATLPLFGVSAAGLVPGPLSSVGAFLRDDGTWATPAGSGGGTVNSVGLALPGSLFSVTGSPVTNSGTLTGSLVVQSANRVWAGPTNGADSAPTFRALVAADLPATTVAAGSYGSATQVAQVTVDSTGRLTFVGNVSISIPSTQVTGLGTLATQSGTFSGTSSGTNTGDQTITLTGDVTGSGTGSFTATLANTAVAAGTYGSATQVAQVTVDSKGRLTFAGNVSISIPSTQVTGLGGFATADPAAPPAIGGTTPAAGTFSGLTATIFARLPGAGTAASDVYIASNFLRWRDGANAEQVALTRAGNLENLASPATALANIGGQAAVFPVTAIAYAATVNLDITALNNNWVTISLTGNLVFTTSNRASGRTVVVQLFCDATARNLTFPAAWNFIGDKPSSIAASKTAVLTLAFTGTADTNCTAGYKAQT